MSQDAICSVQSQEEILVNKTFQVKVSSSHGHFSQQEICDSLDGMPGRSSFNLAKESLKENIDQHKSINLPRPDFIYSDASKEGAFDTSNRSNMAVDHAITVFESKTSLINENKEKKYSEQGSESNICGFAVCRSAGLSNNYHFGMHAEADIKHDNSSSIVQNLETALQNFNQEEQIGGDCAVSLRTDCTLALWVKWRGKWQTGIKCLRADCPLQTLRTKPRHDRKIYSVIFFPHTRTYSWADMQLACPLSDLPEPLPEGNHSNWLMLVKDLTIPRHFIMSKLAVSMLNISDQLHIQAVTECARKAITWEDFAAEASSCKNYSDLGKMLIKLQKMILARYISSDWLRISYESWIQRCINAQSADLIELLIEELVEAVSWSEVEGLWDAPLQPELGSEWKTWKQEAMKLFDPAKLICSPVDFDCQRNYGISCADISLSKKRPKLEIRRTELGSSEAEAASSMKGGTDFKPLTCMDLDNPSPVCSAFNIGPIEMDVGNTFRNIVSRSDEILVRNAGLGNIQNAEVSKLTEDTSGGPPVIPELNNSRKYRRCSTFIEAKGRQCGRWANDGDIYCCFHQGSRSMSQHLQMEQIPPIKELMCEGTTTHGKKCKHRAQHGLVFCKKHKSQEDFNCLDYDKRVKSLNNNFKRRQRDVIVERIESSRRDCFEEVVSAKEIQDHFEDNLVTVIVREALDTNKYNLNDALPAHVEVCNTDAPRCIVCEHSNNIDGSQDFAIRYNLYCGRHFPNFLKRARNGRSRFVSKEVFVDLVRYCISREEMVHLHRACELLYSYMKTRFSLNNLPFNENQMSWILSEASKDLNIGEYLLKLVSIERQKICRLWGFSAINSSVTPFMEKKANTVCVSHEKGHFHQMVVKCKICAERFCDNETLGIHWKKIHKKEARSLFRGYACAVCMCSFTNKNVLEVHVIEKHGVQFVEHSILLQCMSCNSHFSSSDKLWEHILSFHSDDFRLPMGHQKHDQSLKHVFESQMGNKLSLGSFAAQKLDGTKRYICKLCGLKFDLLPDLGSHYQEVHMTQTSFSLLSKRRTKHHLKSTKHNHSRFNRGLGSAFKLKKSSNLVMKKQFQTISSVIASKLCQQAQAFEAEGIGSLAESHCFDVAVALFVESHRSKPRPNNIEILATARAACCRTYIHNALVEKYGKLPENVYTRAAKLCSESNIPINWHLQGFICPKGCMSLRDSGSLNPLMLLSENIHKPSVSSVNLRGDFTYDMEECHHIMNAKHYKPMPKSIILCEDISFGKEMVPVACVIDEDINFFLKASSNEMSLPQKQVSITPWLEFTYVTERLLDPSLSPDARSSQLGCTCQKSCLPGSCDHVYLFNNDYENARDIYGSSLQGSFSYDECSRIILEEAFPVYECNSMCSCEKTCRNRVLQKGLQLTLEIFLTKEKGWAVRTREPIPRGTFVCEYIGEVLKDVEASKRGERYHNKSCNYLYDIEAHINDGSQLGGMPLAYLIDATNFGNLSRFINHSCSPNLVNHKVLVESMDCQLAHVGLFASRNIEIGEELVCDYRYKLSPGNGLSCQCGSSNCRGHLH